MKRKALRVRSEGSIHPYVTEAESRKQHSDSPLCNSLLWSIGLRTFLSEGAVRPSLEEIIYPSAVTGDCCNSLNWQCPLRWALR